MSTNYFIDEASRCIAADGEHIAIFAEARDVLHEAHCCGCGAYPVPLVNAGNGRFRCVNCLPAELACIEVGQ